MKDDYNLPEVIKSFLKRGITTVAGLADGNKILEFRDNIRNNQSSEFPDILLGRVVSGTNCHIKDFSGNTSNGPWEIRRAVRRYSIDKYDFIVLVTKKIVF